MTKKTPERLDPVKLRKETREWIANRTIPTARAVARDLENAGEDVHDLVAAIEELESLVKHRVSKGSERSAAKAAA